MTDLVEQRLDALVTARLASSADDTAVEVARALRRFAPGTVDDGAWTQRIEHAFARVPQPLDADAIARVLGKAAPTTWAKLADRHLPLLALDAPVDDAKVIARIKDRDTWTGAIAGRLLGLWSHGPPPSLSTVCDAFAWRQLELRGKPKRCPPEVRAVFLQRELGTNAAPPDRLLRLYVARELGVARAELRALRDALVRHWLVGAAIGPRAAPPPVFPAEVRSIANTATEGAFGDRKVFISAVWDELRQRPTWSTLSLDEFKRRLVSAHQAGDLVLARADLVAAMDPALVAASETLADGASFHFIVREDRP